MSDSPEQVPAARGGALSFAGASTVGRGTPWGTICEIVARPMRERGYDVNIETGSWGLNNGRYVSDGRAELGAWSMMWLRYAYRGIGNYADEGPRNNLRVLAHINNPAWAAIAVNEESGITDLHEIVAQRIPARIWVGAGPAYQEILDFYGLSTELIESFGGTIGSVHDLPEDPDPAPIDEPEFRPWARSGEFDVIIDSLYAGYLPENHHWHEASILWNLKFLPLPDELTDLLAELELGERGWLPHRLIRGLWVDVPTLIRPPDVIYVSAEMSDELAYDLTAAIDSVRGEFRQTHLPLSYDPANVGADYGVPLHPGAESYYRSVGYPIGGPPPRF
ncbi:TAXI family TRAP transporter solute-binding subunit [Leucobacter sp. wl10]|uniref:TAXI family TRAP transporter solute-binding subunit n=1 Tax=Leucobacter sp. wl10 TaxID=2304677 RepID=UPI000E5ACDE9|nr:TAXI family TRAP transporter solute-binding subunit [Leucobacter sp. wl10]RGE19268.1 hypothetical protein D1J51_12110 [Leucobacter sp. wl10]